MAVKVVLKGYFSALTDVARRGDAREESFYPCTIRLQEEIDALYPAVEKALVEGVGAAR